MKQLKKEADHRVTLYKTGRIGDIMVSAKGEFFYLKKGILYGKTDGMSGYSSIKLLQNAMKKVGKVTHKKFVGFNKFTKA